MDVLAELPEGLGSTQLVFLAGLGLMSMVLLVRSRRYFRQATRRASAQAARPSSVEPASSSKVAGQRTIGGPPREYEQWEVAMHDLARDLTGQLDSKIRVLELLIRQADEAAARLERASGAGAGPRSSVSSAARDQALRPSPEAIGGQKSMRDAVIDLQRPKRSAERNASPPPKPKDASFQIAGNPRFERIYALADAGMSVTTIANQIGSQVGEVELILSLRGPAQPPS